MMVSLSGCVVGDGIAHVVKLTFGDQDKPDSPAPVAVSRQPAALPPPADNGPPPPLPAAAPRSSISVEPLAPPSK